MKLCVTLGLALSAAAFGQPRIGRVLNNYSYILPGMPNYGIAQGSIFDVFGTGLATGTSDLQSLPLPKTLNGTSLSVNVNGATTQAILYFVSPTQIAAILPSATPVGTGQVTVTVNGQTSPPAQITVVRSAFGLLSLNGVGNGPAGAFDANSRLLTLTNAANPGEIVTLWGSGLGPVEGEETVAQTPVNLSEIPIEVDIGGRPAAVQYYGRSIYPGLDQINVQVPTGAFGCHVSVVIRSGDIVSNFGSIPVAAGGRTCSEPIIELTAAKIEALLSQSGVNRGSLAIVNSGGTSVEAVFGRFTNEQFATKRPGGGPPLGDCGVLNFSGPNQAVPNPIKPTTLNAGQSMRLSTPSGSGFGDVSIPFQNGGYSMSLSGQGSLRGTYTFSTLGGTDIGPFSAQIAWPGGGGGFTWSVLNNATSAVRSAGLTVTWSSLENTDPNEFIQISGSAMPPGVAPVGTEFFCNVPLAAGRFTIPPAVLLALPVSQSPTDASVNTGLLELDILINHAFSGPAVDLGIITFLLGDVKQFVYR